MPDATHLVVDPGLMQRIDEFLKFALRFDITSVTSSWSLRERFAYEPGRVIQYRGLALTASEHAAVLRGGMPATALRISGLRDEDLFCTLVSSIEQQRLCQRYEDPGTTLTPSETSWVSSRPANCALAAASPYHRATARPLAVYVYTVRVPEVDTVYSLKKHPFLGQGSPKDMERMVPFGIAPDEIIDWQLVTALDRANELYYSPLRISAEDELRAISGLGIYDYASGQPYETSWVSGTEVVMAYPPDNIEGASVAVVTKQDDTFSLATKGAKANHQQLNFDSPIGSLAWESTGVVARDAEGRIMAGSVL